MNWQAGVKAIVLCAILVWRPSELSLAQSQQNEVAQPKQQHEPLTVVPKGFKAVPDELRRLIAYLPGDTETLQVLRRFTPEKDIQQKSRTNWLHAILPALLTPTPELIFETLYRREIRWAILGGRNFDVVSAFGSLRFEGVSILVFEKPLGEAAKEIADRLRGAQTEVRMMRGRNVHVLPVNRKARESIVRDKPWEGIFVVLLDERTLVTATSDKYLEQFLDNLDGMAKPVENTSRVQPKCWSTIKPDADVWMIRTVSEAAQAKEDEVEWRTRANVWSAKAQATPAFQATYWPAKGMSLQDLESTIREKSFLLAYMEPLKPAISIERNDSVVRLTYDFSKLPDRVQKEQEQLSGPSPYNLSLSLFLYVQRGIR